MTALVVKPELYTAPSRVVVDRLDGYHFEPPGLTLSYGENLFRGFPRTADDTSGVPEAAVFVLTRSGGPLRRSSPKSMLPSLVSVFLRGLPREFEQFEDFARVLWAHLNATDLRALPAGWHKLDCQESEPEWNGLDGVGHPLWTINLTLEREE
jgi:hypothetical protein